MFDACHIIFINAYVVFVICPDSSSGIRVVAGATLYVWCQLCLRKVPRAERCTSRSRETTTNTIRTCISEAECVSKLL